MSTGLATPASGGRNSRSCSMVRSDSGGTSSPLDSSASAARIPGPPALVRIATLLPLGSPGWTAASRRRTSPRGCRCGSRRSGGTARRRRRRRTRSRRCGDAARTPAVVRPDFTATIGLEREIRRAMRENLRGFPNDSRYMQDHVGVRVVLPVQQQVVAGDVGLVAHRHERRDPEPERVDVLEHREAERPGLRRHRHPPLGGEGLREGPVHPHVVVAVEQPHAVRADDPQAVAPARASRSSCSCSPSSPISANPAEMTHTARTRARRPRRRRRSRSGAGTQTITRSGTSGQSRASGRRRRPARRARAG
jgi:hypothetical protein